MKKSLFIALLLALFATSVPVAEANHDWDGYHWNLSTAQSQTNPLKFGNNLSGEWQTSLSLASIDWNQSVIKNQIVAGSSNANCDPTSGRVEICNGAYGENGWLGLTSVWAKRGRDRHISQAVVKLNDTYFSMAAYNTSAWRDSVMCHEVGHTLGLDHQDEDFYNLNLGSCLDYSADPEGINANGPLSNLHPNAHDYDMLASIYAHHNSTGGGGGGNGGGGNGGGNGGGGGRPATPVNPIDLNNPSTWGEAIRQDAQGRNSVFRREFRNGDIILTHVRWAL